MANDALRNPESAVDALVGLGLLVTATDDQDTLLLQEDTADRDSAEAPHLSDLGHLEESFSGNAGSISG